MAKSYAHPRQAHKYLRQYVRHPQSVSKYRYRCVKPNCLHYVTEDFIVGQTAECWRCGKDFVIDKKTAQLKKPHCRECTKSKDVIAFDQSQVEESPI